MGAWWVDTAFFIRFIFQFSLVFFSLLFTIYK
jgi:hypothetical protein